MKSIQLTQGYEAVVDDSDFDYLARFKWMVAKRKGVFYAARGVGRNGKVKIFLMHREILGLLHGDKRQADHKNGNGLDNRRSNLRVATHSQNAINSKIPTNNSSGHKGVSFRGKKWDAYINVNNKRIYLGRFLTKELAARARLGKCRERFGEFAR